MADWFSKLPDEILIYILSFLPTEDAAATSVLSKRWRPLRLSVPSLDLDYERCVKSGKPNKSRFVKMLYVSILARGVHQPIKRINLRYVGGSVDLDPLQWDYEMWLTKAAERGIEHLNIRLSRDPSLSCCIFSSRTLVVLKLEGVSPHASLTVDFPSLKILHLIGVIFSGGWSIWELLIGCPILEDFKAKNIYLMGDCDNPEYKSLTKLVRADISDMGNWDIPLKIFCNIEFLRLGELYMDIPMLSNLTHLELVFGAYIAWHLVFEVLKNSPMLQSFVLDKPQVLSWPCPLLYYPGFVPQCLSSHLVKCALLQITQEENMMFNLQNTFSRIQHLYGRWRSIVLLL